LSPLLVIFRSRSAEISNYCRRRLDRITVMEFFIALLLAALLTHQSVQNQLLALQKQADLQVARRFYTGGNLFFWVSLGLTALYYGLRKISDRRLCFLMTLPLSGRDIARLKAFERLLLLLLILPIWLYWQIRFHLLFSEHALLPFFLFWQISYTAAVWSCGWAGGFILRTWKAQPGGRIIGVPLLITGLALMPMWMQTPRPLILMAGALLAATWAMIGLRLYQQALQTMLISHPHALLHTSARSHQKTLLYKIVRLFTWPAPPSLRPMLTKDALYASRRYRSYGLWLLAAAAALVVSWIKPEQGAASLEWQLAIFIGSAWLGSNLVFKFNSNPAEQWLLLKSLPLSARRFWWSKFYLVFLPAVWLWLISSGVFIAYSAITPVAWLRGIIFSLLLIVSLLFIQNNFSLYSYPFSQWAQFWYNVYVCTALLFFTIWLFPPLALLFVFYGFYATRRVRRRFNEWEPTL
jgi:hypothetical protein